MLQNGKFQTGKEGGRGEEEGEGRKGKGGRRERDERETKRDTWSNTSVLSKHPPHRNAARGMWRRNLCMYWACIVHSHIVMGKCTHYCVCVCVCVCIYMTIHMYMVRKYTRA